MATISAVCCLVFLPLLFTVYVLFRLYLLANKMMMMMMITAYSVAFFYVLIAPDA